jgi:hypothetical protein
VTENDVIENRAADITEWHRLFDAVCLERGHIDNSALASAYCNLTKKKADGAYESALRSLNNWRHGAHLPNRRNARILTLLLDIEEGDPLFAHWTRLYEETRRRRRTAEAEEAEAEEPAASTPTSAATALRPTHRWGAAAAAGLAVALVGGMLLGWVGGDDVATAGPVIPRPEPGPMVIDMTDQRIYLRELAEVSVGESVVIHAKRGRCGQQPPSWEETFAHLPALATGIWSDGGVGYRVSRACGGATPARAVVFTATRPGEDRFMLYEDPVTIRVAE